jgi:beta-N-acetylhexosaminidase
MPQNNVRPAIIGISGPSLTAPEEELLRTTPPLGVILFARNIAAPAQLRSLTARIRALLGDETVLMVDQEGGRVARLRPPYWHAHPPAAALGALYQQNPLSGQRAAWLTGALIGHDCVSAGFNVACAPVLDLSVPGAHDIIGDRAFGADPTTVAALGRALANGILAAGVQPVGKHIPGHGRAQADSHLELPVVSGESSDEWLPFRHNADLPWAMTAHILYTNWDSQRAATLSPIVIEQIIRGAIGFQGVLVSDDLSMRALSGSPGEVAAAALQAGCDVVLHCTGVLEESRAVLEACPGSSNETLARLAAGRAQAQRAYASLDPAPLLIERDRLLA